MRFCWVSGCLCWVFAATAAYDFGRSLVSPILISGLLFSYLVLNNCSYLNNAAFFFSHRFCQISLFLHILLDNASRRSPAVILVISSFILLAIPLYCSSWFSFRRRSSSISVLGLSSTYFSLCLVRFSDSFIVAFICSHWGRIIVSHLHIFHTCRRCLRFGTLANMPIVGSSGYCPIS